MIWRAKHFAILQMIPFLGLMGGFLTFQGIERWWAFGMAMIPAVSLYLIIRHYPDSNTVIIGDNPNESNHHVLRIVRGDLNQNSSSKNQEKKTVKCPNCGQNALKTSKAMPDWFWCENKDCLHYVNAIAQTGYRLYYYNPKIIGDRPE